MLVLVTHAGNDDASRDVAERITVRLRSRGVDVRLAPVTAVADVEPYTAVVIGGGDERADWPRATRRFVRRHEEQLARRPVWLFTCSAADDARPRAVEEFGPVLEPEGTAVFPHGADRTRIEAWADDVADDVTARRHGAAVRPLRVVPTPDVASG